MAKCLHRWQDPARGKLETSIGPYSCGRKADHKGAHAWDGNGAVALWTTSGELFMSIQAGLSGYFLPEKLDAEDEKTDAEFVSEAVQSMTEESGKLYD